MKKILVLALILLLGSGFLFAQGFEGVYKASIDGEELNIKLEFYDQLDSYKITLYEEYPDYIYSFFLIEEIRDGIFVHHEDEYEKFIIFLTDDKESTVFMIVEDELMTFTRQ